MSWKNGKFIRDFTFKQDKEQDIKFSAERLDQSLDDLASGVDSSLNVLGENSMQANLKMNGYKITGVKPGTEISDVATVGQAGGGGVFAEDKSTEASKIDLEQKPMKTITEYKDGMQITFRVKNNSVNNMQVQLNGLGYKSLQGVGVGSFIEGAIKTLQFNNGSFICINSENTKLRLVNKEAVRDLNNVTEPCKFILDINEVENVPSNEWGHVEVEGAGINDYIVQTFTTRSGHVFKRAKVGEQQWQAWQKLMTEEEVKKIVNPLLALAKAGTKNGLFKFTPSKGVLPSRDLLDWESFKLSAVGRAKRIMSGTEFVYYYSYYSIPVQDNIKSYTNAPPIDANLWFYLILFPDKSNNFSYRHIWVGYFPDINNLSKIMWLFRADDANWIPHDDITPWDDGDKWFPI